MIRFFIISFYLFISIHVFAQDNKNLTLSDFNIEKVTFPGSKSSYYKLIFKDSEKVIPLRLYSEPQEIKASFLSEKYLLLVYQGKSGPYLVGAYYDGEKWEKDYFNRALTFSTGITGERLETAEFLDGETLLLKIKVETSLKNLPTHRYKILRICQGRIFVYNRSEERHFNKLDHNPIRPEY